MINIAPYDENWPLLYQAERDALARACGPLALAIEHVGSTSVPGLAAKPVIDILVVLRRHEDGVACVAPLEALGYEYRGANGITARHYFNKGRPHSHHVHMLPEGHREITRLLGFRDHLRVHPEAARAYEGLKRDLARRFQDDRPSYTEAKSEFCASIWQQAGIG